MKNLKDIALILLGCLCLWLLIKPDEPENLHSRKELDSKVKGFTNVIRKTEQKIEYKLANNQILENKINDLTIELETAKQARDTLKIIEIQDTTIFVLIQSTDTLKSIISLKDSIIDNKDSVIHVKDKIIEVLEVDLKKKKRQRNVLGLVGAGLIGLLIK